MRAVPQLLEEIDVKRLLATAAALLAIVALAAGCGERADHNDQDVSFAKNMVPHHQQAVTMADMALSQSSDGQVQDLATRIKTAQTSEISIMQGWLASWGEEAMDHSGDMSGMKDMEGMEGMVSEGDMAALKGASGSEFDRLFLQHMTAHHEGALGMAKVELDKGKYEPAQLLAKEVVAGQEKELAEMAQLQSALRTPTP